MLRAARDSLLFASLAIVGMILLMLSLPDGPAAIGSIAGTPAAAASASTLRLALTLDTILPIGYGAGFVFFALGLARDQRSNMLAIAAVLFTLAGVTMDFVENGLAVAAKPGPEAPFIFATVGKYGLLGLAGVLISGLLTPDLPSSRIAFPMFRYVAPLALALLLSGLAGSMSVWFFAPGLLATFLFAAWVAHCEANAA
ncbi:MAG: hypothetical protein AAGA76_04805 [Pseudomonadota bacterium]